VQFARSWLRREMGLGHAAPAADPPGNTPKPLAVRAPAKVVCTVRVKLPCGVEQLFHVFPERAPFASGRKMKSLRKHLLGHPGSWTKRLEIAELLHLVGDWEGAVAEWRKAPGQRVPFPTTMRFGVTLLKLGEPAAAAEVFRAALRGPFRSAATERHLEGWVAFCNKDAAGSTAGFKAAAELEPENPDHLHGLALAHEMAGEAQESRDAIECALGLNPDDLVALSQGHDTLVADGRIEEAARRAQRLLKLAPNDLLTRRRLVECRCRLGLTRGEAGRVTKRIIQRILRLAPNGSFFLHEPLAAFFVSQGENQKAVTLQRRFVEQHLQCPRGWEGYSRLLAATGLAIVGQAMPRAGGANAPGRCNGACSWRGMSPDKRT